MSDVCDHCGLAFHLEPPVTVIIDQVEKTFCCLGCQSVCQSIFDAGLGHFYQKTPIDQKLTPPKNNTQDDDWSAYDLNDIQVDCVTQQNGVNSIDLLIDNIHCAACVWLIETSFNNMAGIDNAQVNLTTKRLAVSWQPQQVKLSYILKKLQQIGYSAIPFDSDIAEQNEVKTHRDLLYRMAFAGFAMMNMVWVSIALYSGADSSEFKTWFQVISFLIATPTLLYSGYPFLKQAAVGLRRGQLTMDFPIALGACVTYLYSSYILVTANSEGHIYFDTVVNLLFVILVGRYLEAAARRKALSQTHRLMTLQPKLAIVIRDGQHESISIKRVKIGDSVLIRPGDCIPVDGVIIEGESSVNESLLTGESVPVVKGVGEQVIAGSINAEGALTVKAEQVLTQTALSTMLALINQAQQDKAPSQALAEKIVPWFALITVCLAILTFAIWYPTDFEKALLAATSVLIITCPCALGLATPMSIAVATGVAAKAGIIFKKGTALERLAQVNHFVFDKTGTLTEGKLAVVYSKACDEMGKETLWQLAASIEAYSEHPIAKAIVAEAKKQGLALRPLSGFKVSPGKGVSAKIDQSDYLIGTEAYIIENGIDLTQKWRAINLKCEQEAISTIFIVEDDHVSGMMALSDDLRPDAALTIDQLQKNGLSLEVISGDSLAVVKAISTRLGQLNYQANRLPEDKVKAIKNQQRNGKIVAMVGDGFNDAAALAQADVGIAIASGMTVSIEGADIVLAQNRLASLLVAKQLADKTLKIIKQNIMLSVIYNLIMLPLAMMALVNPLVAAITMPISSLLVIANAWRIQAGLKG